MPTPPIKLFSVGAPLGATERRSYPPAGAETRKDFGGGRVALRSTGLRTVAIHSRPFRAIDSGISNVHCGLAGLSPGARAPPGRLLCSLGREPVENRMPTPPIKLFSVGAPLGATERRSYPPAGAETRKDLGGGRAVLRSTGLRTVARNQSRPAGAAIGFTICVAMRGVSRLRAVVPVGAAPCGCPAVFRIARNCRAATQGRPYANRTPPPLPLQARRAALRSSHGRKPVERGAPHTPHKNCFLLEPPWGRLNAVHAPLRG
jgi:hypothetical protein